MFLRLIMIAAGGLAGLFVAKDAPNFELVQGLVGVGVIAAVVLVLALSRRG